MRKNKEIKLAATECLEKSMLTLTKLNEDLRWGENKTYIETQFMISMLGHIITDETYKNDLIVLLRFIAKLMDEDNKIIKEAKNYL